jgi:hypothetical protein
MLRKLKRTAALASTSALMVGAMAVPAMATNDGALPVNTTPASDTAAGQPNGMNATDMGPSPVSDDPATPGFDPGPASADNPGRSTGANGGENAAFTRDTPPSANSKQF